MAQFGRSAYQGSALSLSTFKKQASPLSAKKHTVGQSLALDISASNQASRRMVYSGLLSWLQLAGSLPSCDFYVRFYTL